MGELKGFLRRQILAGSVVGSPIDVHCMAVPNGLGHGAGGSICGKSCWWIWWLFLTGSVLFSLCRRFRISPTKLLWNRIPLTNHRMCQFLLAEEFLL